MTLMFNRAALHAKYRTVHANMARRAAPRYWKSGQRKGKMKTPGLTRLPFEWRDLLEYGLRTVGEGAIQCPYCIAIGRPATLIDLTNVEWDHWVPLKRGGTWDLSNLRGCCHDCNQLKGELMYEVFVGVLSALYRMVAEDPTTAADRDYVLKCLRSHGVVHQFNAYKQKEAGKQQEYPLPARSAQRTLDENF